MSAAALDIVLRRLHDGDGDDRTADAVVQEMLEIEHQLAAVAHEIGWRL